jgi:hypothetical protein
MAIFLSQSSGKNEEYGTGERLFSLVICKRSETLIQADWCGADKHPGRTVCRTELTALQLTRLPLPRVTATRTNLGRFCHRFRLNCRQDKPAAGRTHRAGFAVLSSTYITHPR